MALVLHNFPNMPETPLQILRGLEALARPTALMASALPAIPVRGGFLKERAIRYNSVPLGVDRRISEGCPRDRPSTKFGLESPEAGKFLFETSTVGLSSIFMSQTRYPSLFTKEEPIQAGEKGHVWER